MAAVDPGELDTILLNLLSNVVESEFLQATLPVRALYVDVRRVRNLAEVCATTPIGKRGLVQ